MDQVRDAVVQMMARCGESICDIDLSDQTRSVDYISIGEDWISFYVILTDADDDRRPLRRWFDKMAIRFSSQFDDMHTTIRYYGIEVMSIDGHAVVFRRIRFL